MTARASGSDARDRVSAALAGEPVDRIPVSFWRHFRGIDRDPKLLADATVEFCSRFGLGFVKTMPGGYYCVEDLAHEIDYSTEIPRVVRGPIATAAD